MHPIIVWVHSLGSLDVNQQLVTRDIYYTERQEAYGHLVKEWSMT